MNMSLNHKAEANFDIFVEFRQQLNSKSKFATLKWQFLREYIESNSTEY